MPSDPIRRLTEIKGAIDALRSEARLLFDTLASQFELSAPGALPQTKASVTPSPKAPAKPKTRRRRTVSPSGPLAPAVARVLQAAGKPLKVAEIFAALKASNYAFTGADPKKSLGVRMYTVAGVKSLGGGLFTTSEVAPAPQAAPAPEAPPAA